MAEKKTTAKTAPKKAPAVEKSLDQQLADARKDLVEAQKSHRAGELVNPRILGVYRKEIARIMTKRNAEKEGK